MASKLFDPGREGFLSGEIVWRPSASIIKAHLIRGYTFNAAHRYRSQVTGAGATIVATQALTNLTNTNGVADADDVVFPAIGAVGDPVIPHLLLVQASAISGGSDIADTSQRVIALIDTATGLPATPNGQAVNVFWSPGADRIFKL